MLSIVNYVLCVVSVVLGFVMLTYLWLCWRWCVCVVLVYKHFTFIIDWCDVGVCLCKVSIIIVKIRNNEWWWCQCSIDDARRRSAGRLNTSMVLCVIFQLFCNCSFWCISYVYSASMHDWSVLNVYSWSVLEDGKFVLDWFAFLCMDYI